MGRLRIGGLAIVALSLLPGCGDDRGDRPDPQTIVQAARATEGKGGVHIEFGGTLTGAGIPDELGFEATGDEDRRARTATYEVDLSDFAQLDSELGDPDDLHASTIQRGPRSWMKLPALDKTLTALGFRAGSWVEVDLTERLDPRSGVARSLAELNETDPGQLLDYVHVAQATERRGEETIAGVPTTHYRGRITLDEVARRVPATERPAVEANVERVRRGTGDDELPIDVWIDRSALIRRIRLVYEFERNPETGQRLPLRLEATADLSGFGRRVAPRPPPRSEVVTVSELVEAAE